MKIANQMDGCRSSEFQSSLNQLSEMFPTKFFVETGWDEQINFPSLVETV